MALRENILFLVFAGAVYTPSKFTLSNVSSVHGSDANAGCPSACVRMVSSVRVCDCVGVTTDRTGITLINEDIPMLEVSQLNWAAQLYTATTNKINWNIEFQFPKHFMLRQVDLYLFFCPVQNTPNQGVLSVELYQSLLFPNRIKGMLFGNISLLEGQNCAGLIQVAIPTTSTSTSKLYLLEFSMENVLGGIYIGEVVFRDERAAISSCR